MFILFQGSWRASFIIGPDGRSKRLMESLHIDSKDDLYNYQTYAGMYSTHSLHGSYSTYSLHGL